MKRVFRITVAAALGLVALLAFAACGEKEVATPEVSIKAADYSFALPDSVAGGITRIRLDNTGKESHHAAFARLNDGVTFQQFQGTLQSALQAIPTEGEAAFGRVFGIITFEGGAPAIGPGGQSEVVQDFKPGQYAVVCFVPGPDGVPHIAKGMVKPLTVTAAPKEQPKPPKAAATVSMQDFKYGVPAKFSAGKTVLQVTNDGKQPHEMSLYRLKGISGDQFLQILSAPPTAGGAPPGPPPFEEAGGFGAVMPGATGWTTLDLTRGDYAMLCFIPDPASGKPHLALGMVYSFKVE